MRATLGDLRKLATWSDSEPWPDSTPVDVRWDGTVSIGDVYLSERDIELMSAEHRAEWFEELDSLAGGRTDGCCRPSPTQWHDPECPRLWECEVAE